MVLITDLPPELISLLPDHLSSPDDWYALIRTSHYFYFTCASTTTRFPALFRQRDDRSLLPAQPHMILSGIARQIADWAIQSDANLDLLWEALDKGNVGLLDLGAQVARLSVEDVRALHRDKIEVVKPMAERIHQDIRTRGGYPGYFTIPKFRGTPEVCVFNHVIYSELFHHEIDRLLGKGGGHYIPPSIRHKWIELCMCSPEERTSSSAGQNGVPSNVSGKHSLGSPADSEDVAEDTIDYHELNRSATWTSIWRHRNSSPHIRHSTCALSALDHRGIYSLRLRLFLSSGDMQRLPSDVEEVIYEGIRFSAGLEEAQGQPPEFCDLLEDLSRHW